MPLMMAAWPANSDGGPPALVQTNSSLRVHIPSGHSVQLQAGPLSPRRETGPWCEWSWNLVSAAEALTAMKTFLPTSKGKHPTDLISRFVCIILLLNFLIIDIFY